MVYKGWASIKSKFGTDDKEFNQYVGRLPATKGELNEFARLQGEALDAQLDWEMIAKVAGDNFKANELSKKLMSK